MKAAFLPITCGTALALMAGAATAHFFSVRQTLAMAALIQSAAPRPTTPPDDRATHEARQLLAEAKAQGAAAPGAGAGSQAIDAEKALATTPVAAADNARMERLLTALEGMVEQNAELRNQVAETNRDLMALQFQVDSHSQQFRPLNVVQDASYEVPTGPGVLPPRQTP